MSMFRIQKNKDNPYVMVNKEFLNDDRLSWKAKGILTYLLSLPDDWQIYEEELTKHSIDGIKSTNSGLKELIKYCYINRVQNRNEKGKFNGYEYCVFEVPTVMPKTENGKTENRKKHTTNNNLTNNKRTNKDYTKAQKDKDKFNNFNQRAYDGKDGGLTINDIENKLLGYEQ